MSKQSHEKRVDDPLAEFEKGAAEASEKAPAATKKSRDETASIEPTRKKRVYAGLCQNPSIVENKHKNTRVYNTDGATRYCVCDDCGFSWKQIGPPASAE